MGLTLPLFNWTATWVGKDVKIGDTHDRVLANITTTDDDEATFRVSFHVPNGTVQKDVLYKIAKNDAENMVWVKGISANRLQIVFGEKDPAEGINYANTGEVAEMPF